jgi:hypothetical protein
VTRTGRPGAVRLSKARSTADDDPGYGVGVWVGVGGDEQLGSAAQESATSSPSHGAEPGQLPSVNFVRGGEAPLMATSPTIARFPKSMIFTPVRSTMQSWPNLGGGPPSYFVDTSGGVMSADLWGIADLTEANPVHEVDQYGTGDGLLTSLHTTCDVTSLPHITGRPVADFAPMQALIQGYADTWSSGEPSSVAALYAEMAWRADTLRGESAEGRQAISASAARSFSSYPGAAWRVETVFGDSGVGGVMTGGILTVRLAEPDACELGAAVVLETNEAQEIVTERVYWELESLIRCGLLASVVSAVPTD